MPTKEALLAEIKQESLSTRKILERVPFDKKDWKPHEKSMSLGRLATHIAENGRWISDLINIDDFDFAKDYKTGQVAASSEELLQIFQSNIDNALADLSGISEEDLDKIWTVRRGEQVMFSIPRKVAMRGWGMNHMVHHRGQLSVYLRLLDVPVPGMYGPSADDNR